MQLKHLQKEAKPLIRMLFANIWAVATRRELKVFGMRFVKASLKKHRESTLPEDAKQCVAAASSKILNELNYLASLCFGLGKETEQTVHRIEIEKLKEENDDFQKQLSESDAIIIGLEEDLKNIEHQLEELEKQHEALRNENSEFRGKQEMLNQRIQQLSVTESEYTQLLRKFGNLEGQLESIKRCGPLDVSNTLWKRDISCSGSYLI